MAKKKQFQLWLAPLLLPLSWIFGAIAVLRQKLSAWGMTKSHKSSLPCLCVGNISWGGTGKSPVIDYLLKYFEKKGIKTFVLTRGYGTKLPHYPYLLDNGSNMGTKNKENTNRENKEYREQTTIALPDEPCMLLEKNPFSHIVIDPNRANGARLAEKLTEKEQKAILLMDDGFQHFALKRDYDLVLLDKDDLTDDMKGNMTAKDKNNNWNTLIPLGSWREPKQALNRATAFLMKCPQEEWQKIKANAMKKLAPYQKPFFVFSIRIEKLVPVFETNGKQIQNYALLAGIGNPRQFQESVEHFLNIPCTKTFFLKDHANRKDMEKLTQELANLEIPLICTEKDMVKLRQIKELAQKEIHYTQTSIEFHDRLFTAADFETWLAQTITIQE